MSGASRRERFLAGLGFGLDDFQTRALDVLDDDVNVLVSAPTGSGKTLVADYAIARALEEGHRAFYTTPLKALSNQKFHELGRLFGVERVGLLTGDTSVQRDAPVVVMTTEVLRNMLLTRSDQIAQLGLVILDEVHYLQDPFRGGVWEEVLILSPAHVRFVALSATVGNAEFVGEWLSAVRGATRVIVETERPITLHHHVAVVRRGQSDAEVLDLLAHDRPSDEARRIDNLVRATRRFRPGPRWQGRTSTPPAPFRAPRRSELLLAMERLDLLPVIVFIFSRAACDDAVRQCRRDGLRFTDAEQRDEIERIAESHLDAFSDDELAALEFGDFLDSLRRGLAAHHAGMVPAFREIVEHCFERNLLSVVFATETLALGVNMPARSVALEKFSKFSDAGRQFLTSGEFSQLSGRAGRRGLDDEGHAVVCFANEVALRDVARVALSPPSDLHSSFKPTYNLTANLMAHVPEETALAIVRSSYAQFEADHRPTASRRSLSEQLAARHRVLEELGYADGWRLLAPGHLLRSLYHESDLLIAQSLAAGIFDDLEPATLTGVLSSFVYEGRRTSRRDHAGAHVSVARSRTLHDHLGQERRDALTDRVSQVKVTAATIAQIEGRYRVPHAREPDGSFARPVAAWARGATLRTVLDLADLEVGLTSPGDFVRTVKQVADLCDQLGRLGEHRDVARVARQARDALVRSVVASDLSVHPPR